MATLLSSGYQPFVIAGLLMAGLVLIETLSLILGFSLSLLLDHGFDVDGPAGPDAGPTGAGLFGSALGWLNAGRVPILVLLIAWLAAFAAVGFFIQTLSGRLFVPLPTLVAVVISGGLATPATRLVTRLVAFAVPSDETYAVSNDELIGRVAQVILGPLDQGAAGRVKVRDPHGNWHFLMARAAADQDPIPVGTEVLLVDRSGPTFVVLKASPELTTVD